MGRRSSQRRNAAMLDSDDTDSPSSSSSDLVSYVEKMQPFKNSSLQQCVDALYTKRGSTRDLVSINDALKSSIRCSFVEKNFETLLHGCLEFITEASSIETELASNVIGLLALITGPGEKAKLILEESFSPISVALECCSDSSKISSLLECLAIITFIGSEDSEATEKSMQVMWQVLHPEQDPNATVDELSPPALTSIVSAWSFLLTSMDEQTSNLKNWHDMIYFFSTLLDKDETSICIAAGEALALIFELVSNDMFCGEIRDEGKKSRELVLIQRLRSKVLNQIRILCKEGGGKGCSKEDLDSQRKTFRDIRKFFENGYSPETSMKIGETSLTTYTWAELIQINFLKNFLGRGFLNHMQENESLHDVFSFTPTEESYSVVSQRFYGSHNKARTKSLNRERMISQENKHVGYRFGAEYEV